MEKFEKPLPNAHHQPLKFCSIHFGLYQNYPHHPQHNRMLMHHLKTWRPCLSENLNPSADKVTALTWSPDGTKLAVATVGRMIWLYDAQDGVRRDKFPTKSARQAMEKEREEQEGKGIDSAAKTTTVSYVVTALAFSPDSIKLSVAQSDGGVYVYKLGRSWGHKKSISHKFSHDSPVTSMLWPPHLPSEDAQLVYGLADGRVIAARLKSNKAKSLGSSPSSSVSESYVIALALHPDGASAVISAHYDGSLCWHPLTSSSVSSSTSTSRLLARHTCSPFVLAWIKNVVVAAGNDQHVAVYHPELGQVLHVFDYSSSSPFSSVPCREFTCAAVLGSTLVVGNFDSLYVYKCASSTQIAKPSTATPILEHVGIHYVPHLYSATALAWSADERRLAVGSFCGAVDVYESMIIMPSSLSQQQNEVHHQYQSSAYLPLPSISQPSHLSPSVPLVLSPEEQLFRDAKLMVFEKGIQLLQSRNLLEAAVDHAMAVKDFAYALKVCDLSLPQRLACVHHQHARYLQQQGQYTEAEESFLFAKAPRDAIDMFLSPLLRDYSSARRLAEKHAPSLVPTILEAQADALLQRSRQGYTITEKDAAKYSQAEALYLAAGQPEQALNMYMEAQHWAEAFRIAHRHLFHRLIDVVTIAKGERTAYSDCLTNPITPSSSFRVEPDDILSAVGPKSMTPLRVAATFLGQRHEWAHVWSMLDYQISKDKDKSKEGGQMQALRDDMVVLRVQQVLGDQKAHTLAVLREALDILKAYGGPCVDHLGFYRCLAVSVLGGRSQKDELEHSVILQALLRDFRGVLFDALRRSEQNNRTRKKNANNEGAKATDAVATDAGVAGVMITASKTKIDTLQEDDESDKDEEFMQIFLSVHYTNILSHISKLLGSDSGTNNSRGHTKKRVPIPSERLLLELACKISLVLLRYSPTYSSLDKAFYTAGTFIRRLSQYEEAEKGKYGKLYKHLAFLLLNRYIDLAEAIEDKMIAEEEKCGRDGEEKMGGEVEKRCNDVQIDMKGLAGCTALPQAMTPIPRRQYVENEAEREEIKTWVLAVCKEKADGKIDQASLPSPTDAMGTLFEGLYATNLGRRGEEGRGEEARCILTGYPLQESQKQQVGGGKDGTRKERHFANKEEWAVWVKAFKTCPWTEEKVSTSTTTIRSTGERKKRDFPLSPIR